MKHPKIPIYAHRLFKWFCKDNLFEELEGDLEETFLNNKKAHGLKKAKRIYWKEVLKMMRPSIVRKRSVGKSEHQVALFLSYTTLATRNLKRHKLFSFINLFSLSVAMSTGLLVIGMITDLMEFDEFHEKKKEIYRVISTPTYNGQEYKTQATSPLIIRDEMMAQIPGIRIAQMGRRLNGKATINEKIIPVAGIYADEHFFDLFNFDLIKGNPKEVLKNPYSIVVSQSFVNKTFDNEDVIGQEMEIAGFGTFVISGIVADPPRASHLQFEVIGSLSTTKIRANKGFLPKEHGSWENLDRYYNYIYIPENEQTASVASWLKQASSIYYPKPDELFFDFQMQRLDQILPGPNISDSIGPKMIFLPIIILSVIAAAILFSAIFNYTNLSMARALKRAREVGVRKLNGASKKAIYLQFTVEAVVLSFLSLALGIVMFLMLRTEFISLIPRADQMLTLNLSPKILGWFVAFALLTGLVAGMAPSIFFARLSSLRALRSASALKTLSKMNFRKVLIVAQFSLSIVFILAVVITNKHYAFALNHNLGFDQTNVLNINLQDNDPDLLKTELMKLSEVSEVSFSSFIPGIGTYRSILLVDPRNQDSVYVNSIAVDDSYIKNMDLELLAGRGFFPRENDTKQQSIIVNEQFLEYFGFEDKRDAVGSLYNVNGETVEIVGVINNFHYSNLEDRIRSFVLRNNVNYQYANVKVASADLLTSIKRIEEVWDKIDPVNSMEAQFHEDQIEEHYAFLEDFMKIFGFIGFLAISISGLGLFGMALYSTEIRMKEIGVRKTFGASDYGLVLLLSKGFLKLVFWGVLIGTPACYLLFDRVVLNQYFYRTDISILDISISIILLMVFSLLTVMTQTWSAARTNPSTVLRNE